MGVGLADYDLDGWMDFFVTNDKVYNSLFHNKGGGKFEEMAFDAGVALREDGEFISGMGVDFRDLITTACPISFSWRSTTRPFPFSRTSAKACFADITRRAAWPAYSPMAGYSPDYRRLR